MSQVLPRSVRRSRRRRFSRQRRQKLVRTRTRVERVLKALDHAVGADHDRRALRRSARAFLAGIERLNDVDTVRDQRVLKVVLLGESPVKVGRIRRAPGDRVAGGLELGP